MEKNKTNVNRGGGGLKTLTELNKYSNDVDKISHFLLDIYHLNHLPVNGLIEKRLVNDLFQTFVQTKNIQKLGEKQEVTEMLKENNFLLNTTKDSSVYKISMTKLFEFRTNLIKAFDFLRMKKKDNLPMTFEGSHSTNHVNEHFKPLKRCCFICQLNFDNQTDFASHIGYHNKLSDFKVLKSYCTDSKPTFQLFYNIKEKSPLVRFTLVTSEKNLIIENIIVVGRVNFTYAKLYKVNRKNMKTSTAFGNFSIGRHSLPIGLETPIIVLFRSRSNKNIRKIEQYHFLIEDFPGSTKKVEILQNKFEIKPKLLNYYPTKTILQEYVKGYTEEGLSRINVAMANYFATKTLTKENYAAVLSAMLQMEDIEIMNQYVKLRQKNLKICVTNESFFVKLKNIPLGINLENVLSPGDSVIMFPKTSTRTVFCDEDNNDPVFSLFELPSKMQNIKYFYGSIERISGSKVYFTVKEKIKNVKHIFFDIIFQPSRLNIIYQHQALDIFTKSPYLEKVLFPVYNSAKQKYLKEELQLFNISIKTNAEQLQAVANITRGTNTNVPYIIFGPPGTGKTSTVVECVLQLWQRGKRILITAGSNAACDEIATRLCKTLTVLAPSVPVMLRVCSVSSAKRIYNMDNDLIQCSNLKDYKHIYPAIGTIKDYNIIVATLPVVGRLVSTGIGKAFFTHVFVDECAASSESEVLVGISGILSPRCSVILSGDHKQLGAILQSNRAKELGLDRSLMDRLITLPIYNISSSDYNTFIQSRLVQNFRSHPNILQIFSDLYYDGKLRAEADEKITNCALGWHKLPNRNFPIIFHSVTGRSEKVSNSTSLLNRHELDVVLDYVKDIMYFGINGQKIQETDIGIISPYKLQYCRIQEELIKRHWNKIDVGSVETFQGREKQIIIVSMVRSSTKSVGFLDNPKRLNVTLSRAQALLILIGNAETLSMVEDWKKVIDYCTKNNAMVVNHQRTGKKSKRRISRIAKKKNGKLNKSDKNRKTSFNNGTYDDGGDNVISLFSLFQI